VAIRKGVGQLPLLNSIREFDLRSNFLSVGCYPSRGVLRTFEKARGYSKRRVLASPGLLIVAILSAAFRSFRREAQPDGAAMATDRKTATQLYAGWHTSQRRREL